VCNAGEAGGGCETTEVCQDGLTCELVLDLGALGIVINTCSECSADADCDAGQVCGVDISIIDFAGQRVCQAAGSVPNNNFCVNEGTVGNDACASGFCGLVDVEGLLSLNVCGECLEDADCGMGEVCQGGAFDLGSLSVTGSTCAPG
jgi:Cys-rich repeat protein